MDHYAEVFLNVPDNHGDLEADTLIFREEDHAAGAVTYRAEETDTGRMIYERNVPSTPEWTEQVKVDIAEAFSGHDVRLLLADGNDW